MSEGWVEPVSDAAIAERLRRLREDPTDWLGADERWSLAGAQSKFTLRDIGDGWGLAHGSEPSTHIIKPGISTIAGQALIEHVTSRSCLARASGPKSIRRLGPTSAASHALCAR